MTEFINIVSRVEWKDICGIDFQVLSPSSVKDSNKESFIYFPKVSFLVFTFYCHPIVTSPTFSLSFLHFLAITQNILRGASVFHKSSGVCPTRSYYSVELSVTLNHARLLISPCLCCQHNAVVVSFKNCSPGLSLFFAFLTSL